MGPEEREKEGKGAVAWGCAGVPRLGGPGGMGCKCHTFNLAVRVIATAVVRQRAGALVLSGTEGLG